MGDKVAATVHGARCGVLVVKPRTLSSGYVRISEVQSCGKPATGYRWEWLAPALVRSLPACDEHRGDR